MNTADVRSGSFVIQEFPNEQPIWGTGRTWMEMTRNLLCSWVLRTWDCLKMRWITPIHVHENSGRWWLPSGKLSHNYWKSHYSWVNQLFLWPVSSSQTLSLPEGTPWLLDMLWLFLWLWYYIIIHQDYYFTPWLFLDIYHKNSCFNGYGTRRFDGYVAFLSAASAGLPGGGGLEGWCETWRQQWRMETILMGYGGFLKCSE